MTSETANYDEPCTQKKGFFKKPFFWTLRQKQSLCYNHHGTTENKSDYWEAARTGTVEVEVKETDLEVTVTFKPAPSLDKTTTQTRTHAESRRIFEEIDKHYSGRIFSDSTDCCENTTGGL